MPEPVPARPVVDVSAAAGGWPTPWPAVAELARVLDHEQWTLVGGLMTQLHVIHYGVGTVRPTNDVDIVLHIETGRGRPNKTAAVLESLGYQMQEAVDPRSNTAHRFVRNQGAQHIDVVTDAREIVDVLQADHPAPRVVERMRGRDLVSIEGGTQALNRTINARLEIVPNETTTISVPRPFGALILKAAAFVSDSRNPERHLFDAAALLACIEDPFTERATFAGSDRRRLATLDKALMGHERGEGPEHSAWLPLPDEHREDAQAALRILCSTSHG